MTPNGHRPRGGTPGAGQDSHSQKRRQPEATAAGTNRPTIGAVRRHRGLDPEAVQAAALERVVAVVLDGHHRWHALTRLADAHEALRRGTRHRAQIAAELRAVADRLAA